MRSSVYCRLRVVAAEAPRVHLPGVEARQALDDPLRDELAHAAGARQPVRAEPGGDPEAAHVGRAEDELAVRGEGLRPVDEPDDLCVLEVGDAHDRVLHQLLEAVPVLFEQLAVEVRGDAVETPRRGLALVAAHDQPARLAAEVDEERGVAHGRQVERQAGRTRDQVLVRHRDDRDGDARHGADLRREHAARVDDDLRGDRALVGLDTGHAAALDADSGHARVGMELGPVAPGALGERERQLAGVDVAVGRYVRGAEHALRGHRREQPLRILGGDQLDRQPERPRPPGLALELLHALLRRRQPERADLVPAGLQADLLLQGAVEIDRGDHHLREAQRAAELADEARGVEGRAAGQVGSLDQDDVVPAEPGEPVEDGRAADSAADDDRARSVLHCSNSRKAGSAAVRSSRAKCSFA